MVYARFRMAESYQADPRGLAASPPPHELDQGPTREALRQIQRFITDFPDDPRVREAEGMAALAPLTLARHELYVAG